MKNTKTFTVTEDHLKLLKRMYTGWNDCEFGAVSIDPKRPFGNSSVMDDLAEIIGYTKTEGKYGDFELTVEQEDYLNTIYRDMQTVLQILLANSDKGIKPGVYIADLYSINWRLHEGIC